ncbi:hypothetical protein [Agreia sp. VKM Ac-1783]|uniref:hypothetical protein n=1 Tax=Agreia sp. VKM Ac-1783 TaxID=1938889 RepID=UPI000A2ABBD2|nr:hypothetical protein [Agreia sp. VKM Ac-1783]SMQ70738.1 hypothetical protein SAMN06295943_1990 [Agreia sp. VKM Ac-1783]
MTRGRILLAAVGVLLVAAYAALMAVESLVLDPLAAVPGATLGEIHARLAANGMDVGRDIAWVICTAAAGVVLAVAAAVVGLWRHLSLSTMAMIFLAIIAAGAVPAFLDGIHLGMDIADTYRGTGGAHTIWAGVLYVTSLAAVGGIVEVGIYRLRRSARSRFRKKSADDE